MNQQVEEEEYMEQMQTPSNLERYNTSDSDDERNREAELFSAIRKGKLQKVRELLRSGVKTNIVDKNNRDNTPLHYAVQKGNKEIVEELLLAHWKTNINATNNKGDTPLQIAVSKGNRGLAQLLASKQATFGIKNNIRKTQLGLSNDQAIISPLNKPFQVQASSQNSTSIVQSSVEPQQLHKRLKFENEESNSKTERICSTIAARESQNRKRPYIEGNEPEAGGSKKLRISEEYAASGLKSSLHGTAFQQKLLMIVLKRGLAKKYSFRLATEMDAAEKFDDLVFQYTEGDKRIHRFLQAKHKQDKTKKISVNDLLTETDGEFSLQKYFISYRKIKKNPEFNGQNYVIKDLIICTNIGFKFGDKHADLTLSNDIFDKEKTHDGEEKIDDILKTVLFRLRDDFSGKEQIVSILKNTSDLAKLTSKLAEYLLDGKSMNNDHSKNDSKENLFELYQFALSDEVIDNENRKLRANFVNGMNLSPEAQNFRDAFEDFVDERRRSFNFEDNPNIKKEDLANFAAEVAALLTKHRLDKTVNVNKRSKIIRNNFDKLAGYVLTKTDGEVKFSSAFLNNHSLPGNLDDFRAELYRQISKDVSLFKNLDHYRFKVYKDFKTCEEIYVDKNAFWEGVRERKLKLCSNFGQLDTKLESVEKFVEKIAGFMEKSKLNAEKIVKIQRKDDIISKNIDKLARDVLFEKEGKIQFSSKFLGDTLLPGNLNDFRNQLKAKFRKLSEYEFHISNFPKSCLPNDSISNIEKDIKSFFDHLVFAVDQPDETELDNIIASEMSEDKDINLIDSNFIASEFHKEILDWMKEKKGRFLTHEDGENFFHEVRKKLAKLVLIWPTLEYRTYIEGLAIFFSHAQSKLQNFLKYSNQKQILNFFSPPNTILGLIKVYQTLNYINYYEKDDSCIIISLRSLLRRYDRVVQAFSLPSHHLLVIECKPTEGNTQELYNQLCQVLTHNKKIILITQENNTLANKFKDFFHDKYEEIRDEKNSLIDLTPESQNKILTQGTFIFQGEAVNLAAVISRETKHLIDAEVLSDLIENKKIQIGKPLPDLGVVKRYYIPRTFSRLVAIKNGFIKNTDKFFIVYNSHVTESDLEPDQDIVVISDTNVHFEKLCNTYTGRTTHWLKNEGHKFIWQRTHGDLSKIRKFVVDDQRRLSLYRPEILTDINEKVAIVAAEPGMGKSTMLTDLAVKTKKSDPSLWVAKIDLLIDCSTQLENRVGQKLTFNSEEAIEFLLDAMKLKTCLEKELFRDLYYKGKIALFFDGYDEISPDYKEEVGELLRFLKDTNLEKVWVTTRPYNIQNCLEDALNAFSYGLVKFSDENQRSFLNKFWKQVLDFHEFHDERSKIFIDKLLQRFSQSIKDGGKKFIGIPLHIKMLADVFKRTFAEFYNSNNEQLSDEQEHKLSENLDLVNLYADFFKIKFDEILFGEKAPGMNKADSKMKRILDKERQEVLENHKKLALCRLFGKDELEILLPRELNSVTGAEASLLGEVKYSKEKTGFIDRVIDNKPVFVHQTFAEYFAALWFTENWKRQEVRNFLRMHIFEERHDVMRNFFDHFLATAGHAKGRPEIFTAVLNNDELRVESLLMNNKSIINTTDQAGRIPLHLAAAYDYKQIVQSLLDAADKLKHPETLRVKDNLFEWSCLSYADKGSHWNVVDLLLQKGGNADDVFEAINSINNGVVNEKGETLLHIAAREGHIRFAQVLVEKHASVNAVDEGGMTPLHLSAQKGQLDIVKYFVDIIRVDYLIPDKQNRIPVFLAAQEGQLDIVKYFINDEKVKLNIENENGEVLLHSAAKYGHLQVVQYLVDKGANSNIINKISIHGGTPLHLAAQYGQLDIVKYLLNNGAEFAIVDDSTPLHWAALYGKLEVVKYFINGENSSIESREYDGSTPLHLAALNGHLQVVEWLVEKGANLNSRDDNDRIPLHVAIGSGKLDVIECLISENNSNLEFRDKDGNTSVHLAAGFCLEVVRYLIEKKNADLHTKNNSGQTLLHRATSQADCVLGVVYYLVEEKTFNLCNEDNEGSTPLHLAARCGTLQTVEYLLNKIEHNSEESRALLFDTERYGMTPLHYAILNDHAELIDILLGKMMNYPENLKKLVYGQESDANEVDFKNDLTVKLILENGADTFMKNKQHTILHEAVRGDNQETIKLVVDKIEKKNGNYINSPDAKGNTPLMWAAMYGKVNTAKLLFEYRANVDAENKERKTALHLAVIHRHENMVHFLMNIVNDINAKDENDRTPLHWAAEEREWDILKILIRGGAKVDAADKDHRIVLHWAAADGNLDVVKFLVEHNTNFSFRDKDGNTPLHLAADGGELDTIKYLIEVKKVDFNTPNNLGHTPLQLARHENKLNTAAYLSCKVEENSCQ